MEEKKIEEIIAHYGDEIEMPAGLLPDQMEQRLADFVERQRRRRSTQRKIMAGVGALILVLASVLAIRHHSINENDVDLMNVGTYKNMYQITADAIAQGTDDEVDYEPGDKNIVFQKDDYIYSCYSRLLAQGYAMDLDQYETTIRIMKNTKDGAKCLSRIKYSSPYGLSLVKHIPVYVEGDRLYAFQNTTKDLDNENQRVTLTNLCIVTYDISDRYHPKEINRIQQSGYYLDSFEEDGYLYIMSRMAVSQAFADHEETYVPYVDGTEMSEKHIMVPFNQKSQSVTVMTAISLKQPDQYISSRALIGPVTQITCKEGQITCQDASYRSTFLYQNGKIKPAGASLKREKPEEENGTQVLSWDFSDGKVLEIHLEEPEDAFDEETDYKPYVLTMYDRNKKKIAETKFNSEFDYVDLEDNMKTILVNYVYNFIGIPGCTYKSERRSTYTIYQFDPDKGFQHIKTVSWDLGMNEPTGGPCRGLLQDDHQLLVFSPGGGDSTSVQLSADLKERLVQ